MPRASSKKRDVHPTGQDIRSFFLKKTHARVESDDHEVECEEDTRRSQAKKQRPDVETTTTLAHEEQGSEYLDFKALLNPSWYALLMKEWKKPYIRHLQHFMAQELEQHSGLIYPPRDYILSAFAKFDFRDTRVIILGQDPYHGPNQAHGLSFSVLPGIAPPPSLKNIFKELRHDLGVSFVPGHGCLDHWTEQGVLLLNTVLTVRASAPNSHRKQGWEELTTAVIRHINRELDHCVFLLWGKPAQAKAEMINTTKHRVIKTSHPSPLGATKTNTPFLGSKCFSTTNDYLHEHGQKPIDWSL